MNGLLSVDAAIERMLASAPCINDVGQVATMAASGRVLAEAQRSTIDVPDRDNSAMDGYAVRVADCASGEARLRVTQRIAADTVGQALEAGTAARIFTGAPIPAGADAVVMQEQTEADGDEVRIKHTPPLGEWIRRVGEDIAKGATILPAGTRLRAQETGLAASVGLATLPVRRRPRVALFLTGDELVMPGAPLPAGKIYNSSRFTLSALLHGLGCEVSDLGIVPDSLQATRETLRRAAVGHDLVVTSGGMSVGEEDHVRPAMEQEGRLDLWKIAMKPGKPLAFGELRRDGSAPAAFIGLPGNPVSSFVCTLLFVRPFLLAMQGGARIAPPAYMLRADFDWMKPDARREFLRVRVNEAGGLDLFTNQSSSVLTSTVWGDGLLDNPPKHAICRGDLVRFLPFAKLMQ